MKPFQMWPTLILICGSCIALPHLPIFDSEEDYGVADDLVSVRDFSDEIDDFWTADRMESVKPMPLPIISNTSDVDREAKKADRRKRSPQLTEIRTVANGRDDNLNLDNVKPAPLPSVKQSDMAALGIQPGIKTLAFRGLWSSDRSEVETADVTEVPFNTYGKLLFQDAEGDLYECTGQYISPYVVLTAGHCVYNVESDPPAWNQHFRFVQQYEKKLTSRQSGTPRKVQRAVVHNKWLRSSGRPSFAYDFAMLIMSEPSVSGYVDIGYPDDYDKWTTAGYPENYARGKVLQKFKGEKGRMTRSVVETVADPMGPGCSGGGWIAEANGKNYVVGVNSFSVEGITSMFSPRFTQEHVDTLMSRVTRELNDNNK